MRNVDCYWILDIWPRSKYRASCVVLSAILCACSGSIDRNAFSPRLTYAVVAFNLTPAVHFLDESDRDAKVDLKGRDKMLATRPVANRMAREFIGGFVHNAPVKIVHGRQVTRNKQYLKLLTENINPDQGQYIAAGNYHKFQYENFTQPQELAAALGVDGVILIYCNLTASGTATLLSDGEMRGVYRPGIHARIVAYDKYGKRVINSGIKYKSAKEIVPEKSGIHYLELRRTLAGYDARLAGIAAGRKLWSVAADR